MNLFTVLTAVLFIACVRTQFLYFREKGRSVPKGSYDEKPAPHSKFYLYLSWGIVALIVVLFFISHTALMQWRLF